MPSQIVLVQSSIVYCMVHMYILLLLVFEHRGSRKIFLLSFASLFGVIGAVCLWLLFTQGVAVMGQWGD
ncbi:MAG: hypothetical protein HFE83_10275 [Lachnospiraceae bacterium]|jgi:hypothetical protein|nr:hypothetical protein [Lachnospiraceae bacterium]